MKRSFVLGSVLLAACASATPAPSVRGARTPLASSGSASGAPAHRAHTAPSEESPVGGGPEEAPLDTLGGGLVITGASRHRYVLFTFDDGPDPRHTPAILDALDAADVRAVFFVVPGRIARGGARGEEERALVRAIRERGHLVGSHSLEHEHLPPLSDAELARQVVGAEEVLADVLGERPLLFRPPGGARSTASDLLLRERGYTQMLWSIVSGDFLTTDPDRVVSIFARSLAGRARRGLPGGIVLMHDTHAWTVAALPRMLALLDARNCELLAAGEELYDPSPDPSWLVVPAGDAPPGAEAPLVEPPAAAWAERQAVLRARATERCPR